MRTTFCLCALALVACGGSDPSSVPPDPAPPPLDAGKDARAPREAGSADATMAADDAASDTDAGALDDAADAGPVAPPQGTHLITSAGLTLMATTTDDYAVYVDASGSLWAAPLAGGSPELVGTGFSPSSYVVNSGKVVFAWRTQSKSALAIWSKSGGAHEAAAASMPVFPWSWYQTASADGATVVFFANVQGTTTQTADVVVASADLATQKTLAQQVTVGGPACFAGSQIVFAGSTPRVLLEVCDRGTLSTFAAPSWTRADLVSDAALDQFVTLDSTGSSALVATATNAIEVVPLDGSPLKVIAQQQEASSTWGFGPNDASVCWVGETSHAMWCSPVSSPKPTMMVASGVGVFERRTSPDRRWLQYWAQWDPRLGGTGDYGASTVTPNQVSAYWTKPYAEADGEWWTADSAFHFFVTEFDAKTFSGTLRSVPSGGGPVSTWGQGADLAWQITGSKISYEDGKTQIGHTGLYRADIRTADLATADPPKLLVSSADATFLPTTDRTRLVYTYGAGAAADDGLWVMPAQ